MRQPGGGNTLTQSTVEGFWMQSAERLQSLPACGLSADACDRSKAFRNVYSAAGGRVRDPQPKRVASAGRRFKVYGKVTLREGCNRTKARTTLTVPRRVGAHSAVSTTAFRNGKRGTLAGGKMTANRSFCNGEMYDARHALETSVRAWRCNCIARQSCDSPAACGVRLCARRCQ